MMLSDVGRLSVAYIMNIHGSHSYWKQGALGAAGLIRREWAGAASGVRGGGISCGLAHRLFYWREFVNVLPRKSASTVKYVYV